MRIIPGLQLRKIGRKYMIVKASEESVNMTDVFTLNETAAGLWKEVENREFSVDELVAWLTDHYEVETVTAQKDVDAILETWKEFGLIR